MVNNKNEMESPNAIDFLQDSWSAKQSVNEQNIPFVRQRILHKRTSDHRKKDFESRVWV